jgi:hypothetical protein
MHDGSTAAPATASFALFYPFLPRTVTAIPDVVKVGLALTLLAERARGCSRRAEAAAEEGTVDAAGGQRCPRMVQGTRARLSDPDQLSAQGLHGSA